MRSGRITPAFPFLSLNSLIPRDVHRKKKGRREKNGGGFICFGVLEAIFVSEYWRLCFFRSDLLFGVSGVAAWQTESSLRHLVYQYRLCYTMPLYCIGALSRSVT